MFVQLIVMNILFHLSSMERMNSSDICEKRNLCRSTINELCHPIILKCHNHSCHYRRLNITDHRYSIYARWFYDSYEQRCRRYSYQLENFVYFRFLSDCQRACPVIELKPIDQIVTLHIWNSPPKYNETVYVQLQIDLSPSWMQQLTDRMNISTSNYRSQVHYFQNYRRHFAHFHNPMHQLMFDHPKEQIHSGN